MGLRYIYNEWISPQRWLDRMGVGVVARIVMGLVLLTACVLLLAKAIRLFPTEEEALLHKRALLCETTALQTAAAASRNEFEIVRDVLDRMPRHYPEVLSAGLRGRDGKLLVATRGHAERWNVSHAGVNTMTHVRVPLLQKEAVWGQLEICFAPVEPPSTLRAWWSTRSVQFTAFVVSAVFLLFWIYLARMLTTLDPSSAIPARMQVMMDTLVEGMIVIDERDRIVMANQSFASSAFSSIERLIGRELSSLPWLAPDLDSAPEWYAWRSASQSNLPERNVSVRLQVSARHTRRFNVNASPILDPRGARRGVLVTFADQTVIAAENLELAQFVTKFNDEIRRLTGEYLVDPTLRQLSRLEELANEAQGLAQVRRPPTADHRNTEQAGDVVTGATSHPEFLNSSLFSFEGPNGPKSGSEGTRCEERHDPKSAA